MRNWIQPGDIVTVVAPVAVNSGEGLLVGALFGVAVSTAAISTNVELSTTGVVDLPKAAVAVTQGAKLYWDNTAKNVTTTVGTNILIGCAIVAAVIGDATVRVRLNGVVT
jgi:predicted RecA/RadA family phage recombinase